MGDLSRALEESNKFEEDISIAERRAIPCSQNLGMSHFDILIALNALGIILWTRKDSKGRACEISKFALVQRRQAFADNDKAAELTINLGIYLSDLQKFAFPTHTFYYTSRMLCVSMDEPLTASSILQQYIDMAESVWGAGPIVAASWYGHRATQAATTLPLNDKKTL